jgi:hypothetical protein
VERPGCGREIEVEVDVLADAEFAARMKRVQRARLLVGRCCVEAAELFADSLQRANRVVVPDDVIAHASGRIDDRVGACDRGAFLTRRITSLRLRTA